MYNGVINVYKEKGFTSHDVVAKMRGILKQKKIGHTGTLDPDAEGVLPVCLGSGTKLCDMLTDKSKEYVATVQLGVQTDTQDMSGKVLKEAEVHVTDEEVRQVVSNFVGDIMQIPPMYSALKINGQKLYELARKGQEVERKPRPITIHEIEILEMHLPEFKIRVKCSKGTYIRTLCNDIGEQLGCYGAMKTLLRTKVSPFVLEDAHTLEEIEKIRDEDRLSEIIVPVDVIFAKLPECIVKKEFQKFIDNGNSFYVNQIASLGGEKEISKSQLQDGYQVRVYNEEHRFYGIFSWKKAEERFVPEKMFLER